MKTLHLGDATITRVQTPRCSSCARWGLEMRCSSCWGRGYILECRARNGDECRARNGELRDPEAYGYHVVYGSLLNFHICGDKKCMKATQRELVEMQRPVAEERRAS